MDSFLPIFSSFVTLLDSVQWMWIALVVGFVAVLVFLIYWFYQAFKTQLVRQQAENLYREWQSRVVGRFNAVPDLMDRAGLVQYATEVYSGKTSELIHQGIQKVDELYLTTRCGASALDEVGQLIYPAKRLQRFYNRFKSNRYRKALQLLQSKSIGYNNSEQRLNILYANTNETDFRNLLGREEDYPPFMLGFEELVTNYPTKLANAQSIFDRIEQSIERLPDWLTNVGSDLDRLNQQIQWLAIESRKDGFFPLNNLQEKLLPSTINLIDECIRQGAMDPVVAFESPARLAIRQIDDIQQITQRVELLRTRDFPLIEEARSFHQVAPMSYTWIDEEMSTHSKALETICNHAVLWPVAEHLEVFSKNLDESLNRASACAEIARGSSHTLTGLIDTVEKEFQKKRSKLAKQTGFAEDQLMVDADANPGELIKSMRQSHHSMREALGAGQVQVAQSKESYICQSVTEVRDMLDVTSRVARVGEQALGKVEARYDMLAGKVDSYTSLLNQIGQQYHPDVLIFAGERLCHVPDSVSNLLTRVEASFSNIEQDLASGHYLSAGRLLEEAAAELRFGELKVEATEQQYELICDTAELCEKRLADARFRHRSLDSRMEDRRTRQSTLDRHHALTDQIEVIENQLSNSASFNPFQLQTKLETIFQSIEQLEDRVVVDWDWYELASVSVKGAARGLRRGKEKDLLNDRDGLKDKVDHWQQFLEQDHSDWLLAHQAGFEIELTVAQKMAARNGAQISDKFLQACQSVSALAEWENVSAIRLDRGAGRERFEKARVELLAGNIQKATAQASLAIQESRSELSAAITRMKFAAFEAAGRKRRQQMAPVLLDSTTDMFDFGRLTPKSMQVVQPLNAHHLRGFNSPHFEPLDNIVAFPELEEEGVAVKQA